MANIKNADDILKARGENRCNDVEMEERTKPKKKKKPEVPIWHKLNLTLEEAAAYSGIGINKLRNISNEKDCKFVLFIGSKRLIKRQRLDEYLNEISVI